MINFINRYCAEYRAEACRERPADSTTEREFAPPGFRARDGLIIDVFPKSQDPWTGKFTFGETAFDTLLACPSPTRLLVASRGACYIVDVDNPSDFWVPFSGFAQGSACLTTPDIVLIWDPVQILATNGERTMWTWTERIDGISEVRQTDAGLSVRAHDPSVGHLRTFLLDARSGNEV